MPIPFGEGMAGRVAASGKPVVIDDLAEVELASPHLRRRGIASLVAIPIAIEERVIGVAHAGSIEPGISTRTDVRLLGLMADRIALAVTQSQLYESERNGPGAKPRRHTAASRSSPRRARSSRRRWTTSPRSRRSRGWSYRTSPTGARST